MNKKGFTLIELIAAIAILGILTIIATPAVLTVRKNTLLNSLYSKVDSIHEAALDYASERIMNVPGNIKHVCYSEVSCEIETKTEPTYIYRRDDCYIVLVKALINGGYLGADNDDKTKLINPINNESLNDKAVCVRFDNNDALNRKMFAYIIGESELLNWDNY